MKMNISWLPFEDTFLSLTLNGGSVNSTSHVYNMSPNTESQPTIHQIAYYEPYFLNVLTGTLKTMLVVA